MNITMVCYRNLLLQSGTNPSSLVGVTLLKCFSMEVPVVQRASFPVLGRGLCADMLNSQWVQKEQPSVNDA